LKNFYIEIGEIKMEKEYIQLPPLERGTDSKVVRIIWEYAQLSGDTRKAVMEMFEPLHDKLDEEHVPPIKAVDVISEEEISDFQETMKDIIGEVMLEGCNLAYWVFAEVFINGRDVEELKEANPSAAKYVDLMYQLFLRKDEEEQKEPVMPS
jgi:hypothetical protein